MSDKQIYKNKIEKFDIFTLCIFLSVFLMGLWGCLAIYNSKSYSSVPLYFPGRQFLWLCAGTASMYLLSKFSLKKYLKLLYPLSVLMVILLVVVLFFGKQINGMRGWFEFGTLSFQPSEFAKIPYIMIMAFSAAKNISALKKFLIMTTAAVAFIVPVILQPDFGTASVFLAVYLIAIWISGINILYFISSGTALGCGIIFLLIQKPYVIYRISGFLNPEKFSQSSGWHILQLQYAMANGGIWGNKWGDSMFSNQSLPLAHSDSVFCTLVEAVGFAGTLPIICAFLFLPFLTYHVSLKLKNPSERILVFLSGLSVSVQALIHISINVTIIPPSGLTLPLFSYGGSSMLTTMILFGIVLSAYNNNRTSEKNAEDV